MYLLNAYEIIILSMFCDIFAASLKLEARTHGTRRSSQTGKCRSILEKKYMYVQCRSSTYFILFSFHPTTKIVNSLRPRVNTRHFADDIYKCNFEIKNEWITPRISLKFVLKVRINNIPALVQIMAWRWPGNKPLSEPMVSLLTHICVTRPQWVDASLWLQTRS